MSRLRGPAFQVLFRDVYLPAGDEPTLLERSLGAALLVRERGVLGGVSAAEVLGASCGDRDAPAEVIAPGGGVRSRPGLLVRADQLSTDEVTAVGGVPVTTAARTAFDLGRRPPLLDAVIALDALARVGGFHPPALLGQAAPRTRGRRTLLAAVALADPRSGSPMETRIRMAIVGDRLPLLVLQHPVGPYALDLAYPAIKLGMEYDGKEHVTAERALRDLRRQAFLTEAGWDVLRFPAAQVLVRPHRVAAEVRGKLIHAARDRGVTYAQLLDQLSPDDDRSASRLI